MAAPRMGRRAALAVAAAAGVAVSWLDWSTGPEASVAILYLVPVLLVAWYCSPRTAVAVAVGVAAVGVAIALTAPDVADRPVIAWNTTIRVVFYLTVVWLVVGQRTLLRRLQQLANTDPLTEVLNRRAFTSGGDRELERARRTGRPVTLLYLDLDGLKRVNDAHGHESGDRMIADAAAILRRELREVDLVARIGGDEFVVLLVDTDRVGAHHNVDRLRAAFAAAGERPIAASIGGWTCVPGPDDTLTTLLERADAVMYQVKTSAERTPRISGPAGATAAGGPPDTGPRSAAPGSA